MRMRSRARSNNPSQIITPQRRRSTWCRIRAKTYSRLGREREGKGREGKGGRARPPRRRRRRRVLSGGRRKERRIQLNATFQCEAGGAHHTRVRRLPPFLCLSSSLLALSLFLSFFYLFIYLFILAEGSKWKLTTEPAHILFLNNDFSYYYNHK
jgi:hypothetical protein